MIHEDALILKRLNQCFWGLWLLVPLLIYLFAHNVWTSPYVFEPNLDPGMATPASFSVQGQLLVGLELCFNIGLYLLLVALMHRLVGRFAVGQAMMAATLRTIQIIAWLLLASGLVGPLLANLNLFLLFKLGDLPSWEPLYFIDLKDLALSLTLFALRILIRYAIELKEDHDLTV